MPIPGQTERATLTSEVEYNDGAQSVAADSNWHIGHNIMVAPSARITRLGSPELSCMLVHGDTTTTKLWGISVGMILMTLEEQAASTQGNLNALQIRRIFNVQRWLQNGSQPPIQTARMGKLITLHQGMLLVFASQIRQINGGQLSSASLCWSFRCSKRETSID